MKGRKQMSRIPKASVNFSIRVPYRSYTRPENITVTAARDEDDDNDDNGLGDDDNDIGNIHFS